MTGDERATGSAVTYERSFEMLTGAFTGVVEDVVVTHGLRAVCDVGGGANPVLSPDFIRARALDYTLLDVSRAELDKAPEDYTKVCADICRPQPDLAGHFDLVFSRMLVEHVPDAAALHANILAMLRPGGYALHFFPTLYALPFLLNRWAPEQYTDRLLQRVFPGREKSGRCAKFPAYYDWCYGPLPRQYERFQGLGFDVVEYRGYFGHAAYYDKLGPLRALHRMKTEYLIRRPHPRLTSYALVLLRKR